MDAPWWCSEAVAEPDQAVAHSCLDCWQFGSEPLCDLGVGVAVVVGQFDRLPLQIGQRVEAAPYLLDLEPGGDGVRDLVEVDLGRPGADQLGAVRGGLLGPDPVDGPPVRDGEDPGV